MTAPSSAFPDDEFGEALMAVIEPQPGSAFDIDAIRAELKSALAGYKVPRHIEVRADLPREDSGKIFKTATLRDPYWEKSQSQDLKQPQARYFPETVLQAATFGPGRC